MNRGLLMKRGLLACIDHVRGDLAEAAAAIEGDDVDVAVERISAAVVRLETKVKELRAA
jgi:hypothetical protein